MIDIGKLNKEFIKDKKVAMKDTINVKERIIEVTTKLIEQHKGNTKEITARAIAEKARVGLGLMKSLLKDVQEQDKAFLSFMLTDTMQVAFLGREAVKEILGYDLEFPEERAKFIEKTVSVLFEDARKEQI